MKIYAQKPNDRNEIAILINSLEKDYGAVGQFLKWCNATFNTWYDIPKAIIDSLLCLSSASPVVSYFPQSDSFFSAIRSINSDVGGHVDALFEVQCISPIIYDALCTLKSPVLPKEWSDLFEGLESKSKATFSSAAFCLPPPNEEDTSETMSYFPHWPVLCARGNYEQESLMQQQKKSCLKNATKGENPLMPGLFTVYCQHGKPR